MRVEKKSMVIFLAIIFFILASVIYYLWYLQTAVDYHGCQTAKGYSWNVESQRCADSFGNAQEKVYCPKEQGSLNVCAEVYMPVCGFSGEDSQTFGNPCFACSIKGVRYYVEGECPLS